MSKGTKAAFLLLAVVIVYSMISQFKVLMFSNMFIGFILGAPFWLYVGRRKSTSRSN